MLRKMYIRRAKLRRSDRYNVAVTKESRTTNGTAPKPKNETRTQNEKDAQTKLVESTTAIDMAVLLSRVIE